MTPDRPPMPEPGPARWRRALEPLGLDYPAIGVTFATTEPTDIPRLDKKIAFCAMLREAQQSGAFFATQEEHGCKPGSFVLGQVGHDPVLEGGLLGPEIGVYETPEANQRIYAEMTRFPEGSAPYTLFVPLEQLDATPDRPDATPDLLIITATAAQAEVVLRAHGYRTGAAWQMRGTSVLGCACLYALPHFTGQMNILITGLHHGMRARDLFPMGLLLMAIPAPLIAEVTDNLLTMADKDIIDLPQYHWGKDYHETHMRGLAERLGKQMS